jgi:hypothetical protein
LLVDHPKRNNISIVVTMTHLRSKGFIDAYGQAFHLFICKIIIELVQ